MKEFLEKYKEKVNGVISGWDRIAIRGTIRWLSSVSGLYSYLYHHNILLKDFGKWASSLTERIRQSCSHVADSLGIRKIYLQSSSADKEELARKIAREEKIEVGPICMISIVEPCHAPYVVGNREQKKLEVQIRQRKCVWIYFYWNDPQWGFCHLRLQTWIPFAIKGCLNGRHWLEQRLMEEKVPYLKSDNCFRWIKDSERAQELLDEQLAIEWSGSLNRRVDQYFGVLRKLFGNKPLDYYWSAEETEWATDIMFHSSRELDRLFPMLAKHGLIISDSSSVLRYLGKINPGGFLPSRIKGDVRGDRRRRHEGIRVKHWEGTNSVKIYNKAGNVLRVETTINNTRSFKVYRKANDDTTRACSWQRMRKGVADLERRARISQKSNERYLEGLSHCETESTLLETIKNVCQRKKKKGSSIRAINPWNEKDLKLLRFLTQGQWSMNGFKNRDLASWVYPDERKLPLMERRKLSSRVTRLLRLLRNHGLIRKISRTHHYQVTSKGSKIATLVIAASNVQGKRLMEMAA